MLSLKKILVIFIFILSNLSAQGFNEGLKREAILQMQKGKYGEAVDLLNKYISANARVAEGYNLRALCREKRQEYSLAFFDYKKAMRLEPENGEYRRNYERMISIWYPILYDKINGHKREIAIDPTYPFNYLEIGKSYRWLENWELAELWYDRYLERDPDPSPDEIIRYTLILTETRHLRKAERILDIYVEKYPDDWRLWSRLGWITYWLGKNKKAEKAFLNALEYKPFFKEAQEGLDFARRQGYIIPLVDDDDDEDDWRYREYPIDMYFRMLRNDPDDDDTRVKLIEALLEVERYEEAYQQGQYLLPNYEEVDWFQDLWKRVIENRTDAYNLKIDEYQTLLKQDPTNKEAVIQISQYFANLEQYEDATELLTEYLDYDDSDYEVMYYLAKFLSYDRRFDEAKEYITKALELSPNNLDYKLLAAQIDIWLGVGDFSTAERYLNEVISYNPDNIYALIALGALYFDSEQFESSQEYADKAALIDASNPDLMQLQSLLELNAMRLEQERKMVRLEEGRVIFRNGNCVDAIPYYEEYISTNDITEDLYLELADLYMCADRYDEAISYYDLLLEENYDFEYDKQRAKMIFWSGDSLRALDEFQRLLEEDSSDVEVRVYLADSYMKMDRYDEARRIYENLEDEEEAQYFMIDQRLSWLPPSEEMLRNPFRKLITNLFSYLIITPQGYWFNDNLDFDYRYGGIGLQTGLYSRVSVGGTWLSGRLANEYGHLNYRVLKGNLFIRPSDRLGIVLGYGNMFSLGTINQPIWEASATYEIKDKFKLSLNYLKNDGAVVLYSPYLVFSRLTAHNVNLDSYYQMKEGLKLIANYQLIFTNSTSTYKNNVGNALSLKIGKYFLPQFAAGYEFYFSDYKYTIPLYYSPQEFVSHSIWGEWLVAKDDKWDINIEGRIGYVPSNDFVLSDISTRVNYDIYERLRLSMFAFLGNSIREDVSYASRSIGLNLYWSAF
ncbi:MAG: tetratricopeptide repeat protein [Ignavibacteria bacterium]|jgi:tetratricopeptide (TPR) repeat protein